MKETEGNMEEVLQAENLLEKLQSDVAGSAKSDFMANHKLLEKLS